MLAKGIPRFRFAGMGAGTGLGCTGMTGADSCMMGCTTGATGTTGTCIDGAGGADGAGACICGSGWFCLSGPWFCRAARLGLLGT